MDLIKAIKTRRSIRDYVNKEVPEKILKELIDCARLAPNGSNKQAWKFVVVTKQSTRERIARQTKYGRFIKDAGACIAIFCDLKKAITPLQDASAATENILLAAKDFGLGSCWVNSYNKSHSSKIEKLLNTPENLTLMTLMAVGYYEQETKDIDKKDLDEVLVWESFE